VLVQVLLTGVLTGGVYAVMVSGLTLIFGVMKVINIAHGAFLVFGAYLSYSLFTWAGIDPIVSILITAPLFFLIGVGLQRSLISRVDTDPGFVVLLTIAIAFSLEGMMGAIWGSTVRTVRTGYTSSIISFSIGGMDLRIPVTRLGGFIASMVILSGLYFLLARTRLGRAIRSTIQNPEAAQLVGVNVARVKAMTFGIGLATVAAGGAMFSLIFSFNASSQVEWISKMLSIIVLGGLGSLPGALVAALALGAVENLSAVVMTSYISPIVFYILLLLVLVFRPQGLFGTTLRES
jgi:branched-chain amino acid transport system permease protein